MTRKEAFAKAEEEYRQARANTFFAYKELQEAKVMYAAAQKAEAEASHLFFSFTKPTRAAVQYIEELNKQGLK